MTCLNPHCRTAFCRGCTVTARRARPCKSRLDVALETARDVLDRTVCECGDLDNDHVMGAGEVLGACAADDCPCQTFRPVAFTVRRKNGTE